MQAKVNPVDNMSATLVAKGGFSEVFEAPKFRYTLTATDKDGNVKWVEEFVNTVTTEGKNDLLDKYFAGSAYTAAWYLGLIDNTGWTAVAATDTAAQINGTNGWDEATAYSESVRGTISWSAASAGSKASSAGVSFSINGTVTVKGAFVVSSNTKSGTSGVLYSAGTFSGDRSLVNTDVLTVTVTMTA